jgi:hypothetical protein
MMNQFANENSAYARIPDGQERLATQFERDDVNRRIDVRTLERRAAALRINAANNPDIQREAGDQMNRFLLCALVNESSRHIKASAERAGESLPMTMIVRSVLRSYRLAAMDKSGPLAGPVVDIDGLKRLNAKVLGSEISRQSRDRVRNSELRLAGAQRLGDVARIKAERAGLELAIESRERLAKAAL